MKALLCLFFVFLFPLITLGQDKFDYTLSSPYPTIDGYQKLYIEDNGIVVSVKKHYSTFYLQKFNASNLSVGNVIAYKDFPKGTILEQVIEFGNNHYLFFSVWDKAQKKEHLFYRPINMENGTFGRIKLLLAVNNQVTSSPQYIAKKIMRGASRYMFRTGLVAGFVPKYDFLFSKDKTKLLVQYRKIPQTKRDVISHDIIGLNVYDFDLELDWNKEVQMPYTEKKMDNLHYAINKKGHVYILCKRYNNTTTNDQKLKLPNYTIKLLKVDELGSLKTDIPPIELEDKFISKIWLHENTDNTMVCAGFYNNGQKTFLEQLGGTGRKNFRAHELSKWTDHADGICYFKIGYNGNIQVTNFSEIPLEILNKYEKNSSKKKNNTEKAQFDNLELKQFLTQEDGSIILIGEQNYTVGLESHTWGNGNNTSFGTDKIDQEYIEAFNDILITKLDANGKLIWMQKLAKQQSGNASILRLVEQGGLSYSYSYNKNNNEHYILFLDNVKNINLKPEEHPATHIEGSGGFLTCYTIKNESGSVSKHSIFDLKDTKGHKLYQFYTHRVIPISNGTFLIEAYIKKKEDLMIKVTPK